MNELKAFLEQSIVNTNSFSFSVKQIILSAIVLCVGFIIYKILVRIVSGNKSIFNLNKNEKKRIVRLIQFIILLIAFNLIFEVLHVNISKVLRYELVNAGKITISIYTLLILLITVLITKVIIFVLETLVSRSIDPENTEKGKSRSIFQITKYLVWILAITFFLDSLGFSITFLIASLSALLVGLGLGIQGFFNDIISGIVILFDHSIKVGDVVEIQGEVIGKVDEIKLRTSKIITRNDVVIIIPNSSFTSENVINWSHNSKKTRFGVKVGVAYGSNVELVKTILIQACKEHNEINSEPEPFVFFSNFGESSLDFEVMFYTENSFRVEMIKSDLRFKINQKFADNGITIPFPQRDIHMYNHS